MQQLLSCGIHSPQTPRPFRIPLSIGRLPLVPVAGIFFCIFLLSVQDLAVLTLGVVLTGVGVVLMVIIGYYPYQEGIAMPVAIN